ncbi:hypothetical protein K227x_32860 [Rubripirellula lacrimiformis]|uniref:Uncharacterized protein n=1 Tax=Rubripirellula lacrimiformis TaxID=1930273 RepID=A0A517NCN1_9BACT|nr:hypothetical protein K227x_32860 [Rubripirellula lacrimiformis]
MNPVSIAGPDGGTRRTGAQGLQGVLRRDAPHWLRLQPRHPPSYLPEAAIGWITKGDPPTIWSLVIVGLTVCSMY